MERPPPSVACAALMLAAQASTPGRSFLTADLRMAFSLTMVEKTWDDTVRALPGWRGGSMQWSEVRGASED